MFRRLWSGLPKDPGYPSSLDGLGYFINGEDEIRCVDDPKSYFKYFLTKNPRWNDRQRFAMNEAVQEVVHHRLVNEGLIKVLLPLGVAELSRRHIPIFVSSDLGCKSRVVVIFGQSIQDLGIIAHRIIGGRGGVNKGSMVSIVQAIQKQVSSPSDSNAPGIILANTGQTWWWPEGKRALAPICRHAIPMASAVHWGRRVDISRNSIPKNSSPKEHIQYLFEEVILTFVNSNATIDVIDASDIVETYLDSTWDSWEGRVRSLAILDGFTNKDNLVNERFKAFLKDRARAWVQSPEALDYPISGPEGNPNIAGFTNYGCPVFSAGPALVSETVLIEASESILGWIQEVAVTPGYKNPYIEVIAADPIDERPSWAVEKNAWSNIKLDEPILPQPVPEKAEEVGGMNAHQDKSVTNIRLAMVDLSIKPAAGARIKPASPEAQKKSVSFADDANAIRAVVETTPATSDHLAAVVTKPEVIAVGMDPAREAMELEKQEMKATVDGFSAAMASGNASIPNPHPGMDGQRKGGEQTEPQDEKHAKHVVLQYLAQYESAAVRALERGQEQDDE
ncbi:hypothetical protein GQ53DRAFT_844719 [Thozetella sp. PMI_491]|nr:hypothetical protein GQ53DRAFT_844719 [Thozetella sp. PMI_491]